MAKQPKKRLRKLSEIDLQQTKLKEKRKRFKKAKGKSLTQSERQKRYRDSKRNDPAW